MSVYVSEVEQDGMSSWCLVWADTDRELLEALAGIGGGGGGAGVWAMRTPSGATWKHFVLTGLGLVLGPHGLRAKLMRQGARPHRAFVHHCFSGVMNFPRQVFRFVVVASGGFDDLFNHFIEAVPFIVEQNHAAA